MALTRATPTDLLPPTSVRRKSPPPPSRGRAKVLRKNITDEEKSLWYELREFKERGHYFRKQVPIGNYIVDFACLKSKLVVELDGVHHGYPEQRKHDETRDAWLRLEGFRVLHFWNDELKQDKQLVLDTILQALLLEGGGGQRAAVLGGGGPTFKPERSED